MDNNNNEIEPSHLRLQTRIQYRNLIQNFVDNRYHLLDLNNDGLEKGIEECDNAFAKVRTAREGVLDAATLKQLTSLAALRIKGIDYHHSLHETSNFLQTCASIIKQMRNHHDDRHGWSNFYKTFGVYHRIAPSMNFMSGRLPTSGALLSKVAVRRTARTPRPKREDFEKERTQAELVMNLDYHGEETSKEIVRLKKCLEDAYKKNKGQPVDFFEFVIHPTLFSRTVENIFHATFLIKEHMASLCLNKNGLPVLVPVDHNRLKDYDEDELKSEHHNGQCITSITMEEWEAIVEAYDIRVAMVPDS